MPTNADDAPIDPTDMDRADGFSPGSTVLVHVPELDLAESGAAPSTDVGASLDESSPIVILDAETGEPVVSNGMSLCKLHHAAFDRHFLTVRPDYVIEVRQSILEEEDE